MHTLAHRLKEGNVAIVSFRVINCQLNLEKRKSSANSSSKWNARTTSFQWSALMTQTSGTVLSQQSWAPLWIVCLDPFSTSKDGRPNIVARHSARFKLSCVISLCDNECTDRSSPVAVRDISDKFLPCNTSKLNFELPGLYINRLGQIINRQSEWNF
jgi:hypothetical protein